VFGSNKTKGRKQDSQGHLRSPKVTYVLRGRSFVLIIFTLINSHTAILALKCSPDDDYFERTWWRLFWVYLMMVILSVPDDGYSERTWWRLFWAYLMKVISRNSSYTLMSISTFCKGSHPSEHRSTALEEKTLTITPPMRLTKWKARYESLNQRTDKYFKPVNRHDAVESRAKHH
jgi:hypothetical protein